MSKNQWMVKTMLLRFKFKNFRSFADETILDLTAANIKEHENTLIEKNGIKVLPVAAIFGANASGKSNLFRAFRIMCIDVVTPYEVKGKRGFTVTPFRFDPILEKSPTEFEVCINIDNLEYRYGFSRNREVVEEEWLFERKFSKNSKAQEKLVFYRNKDDFNIGKLHSEEKAELDFLSSMLEPYELLITAIGRRKKSKYAEVYNWFKATVQVQDFSNDYDEFMSRDVNARFLADNDDVLEMVVDFLKEFDNSIDDIKIFKETDPEDLEDIYKVYSYHLSSNGNKVKIPFGSESSGTKKLFALATFLHFSLNHGLVLWIDELDSKLHPLILRYIIHLFRNKESNISNGQLVFSSHNIVCLDSSDLRRDEIWFVEKNNQVSTLYSLYDFKEDESTIRSDLNFGKHYLAGRFGAIPFQKIGE